MRRSALLIGVLLAAGVADARTASRPRRSPAAARRAPAAAPAPARGAALTPPGMAGMPGANARKPHPVEVAGTVLLPGGKPAAQARVYVSWVDAESHCKFEELTTGTDGKFGQTLKLPAFQSHLAVTAFVPDAGIAWRAVPVIESKAGPIELRLEPGTTLSGRLIRADGRTVSGHSLTVTSLQITFSGVVEPQRQQEMSSLPNGKCLPDEVAARLYQAKTDPVGRFTLAALPRHMQATLKLEKDLILAPGSGGTINIQPVGRQELGLLVAVQPGGLKVLVVDEKSRKPVPGQNLLILRDTVSLSPFLQFQGQVSSLEGLHTDQNGESEMSALVPGDYSIYIQGDRQKVAVKAGETTGPVEVAVRTGPLKGRVVDAAGKPVAGVPILMDAKGDPLSDLRQGFIFGSMPVTPASQTDANGTFSIHKFPWRSATVTVRATRGNDQAEWTGPGDKIGSLLEMRLQPGALVSVTGRLVDPERRPLKGAQFAVIRWQEKPRIAWFSNARPGKANKDGYFKVDGLERGEAFSLIGGSPFTPAPSSGGETAFESPRFDTPGKGTSHSLGDIVIHPLEGPEQLVQLYGIDSQEQFARLTRLMPPPAPAAAAAARQAMERYDAALQAGDLETVHRLTSRASFNWTADRQDFPLLSRFRPISTGGDASSERLRPMRLVSEISLAYVLALRRLQQEPTAFFSFGAAAREVEANPDWVLFAEASPEKVRVAALLRREEGEWRVVTMFEDSGLENIFLMDGTGGVTPEAAGFTKPVPALDAADREAARSAAERYLSVWAEGQESVLFTMTSPLSPGYARDLTVYRKLRRSRLDEGICPLPPGTAATANLRPLADLTQWEQAWLASYSRLISEIGGSNRTSQAPSEEAAEFPVKHVKAGAITSFRYTAGGRDFLILMHKRAGRWQVLEAAVPL
jgi:hypothetical protein